MNQKLANDEIHTLHIIYLSIVTSKRPQNFPQLQKPSVIDFEKLVLRESPPQISLNLRRRFSFRLKTLQRFKMRSTLRILFQNCLLYQIRLKLLQYLLGFRHHILIEILLILAPNFLHHFMVVREPDKSLVAAEIKLMVLFAITMDGFIYLFKLLPFFYRQIIFAFKDFLDFSQMNTGLVALLILSLEELPP